MSSIEQLRSACHAAMQPAYARLAVLWRCACQAGPAIALAHLCMQSFDVPTGGKDTFLYDGRRTLHNYAWPSVPYNASQLERPWPEVNFTMEERDDVVEASQVLQVTSVQRMLDVQAPEPNREAAQPCMRACRLAGPCGSLHPVLAGSSCSCIICGSPAEGGFGPAAYATNSCGGPLPHPVTDVEAS